jgi:hypothetical protein
MLSRQNLEFRFLDTEEERKELLEDIRRVRLAVVEMAEAVPADRQFEPRYHGWSLAAMLAHLHLMDHLAMWQIKLALLNIAPVVSMELLNGWNDVCARVFRRRIVATTIRGIQKHQAQIVDMVLSLPLDRFSKQLYYPPLGSYLTIERGIQAYYLFHWHEHLTTMQKAEGIYYEPPSTTEI